MSTVGLDGCTSATLGSYLQGLGVWNAVVRLLDPTARAAWRGDRLELTSALSRDQLLIALLDHFEPLPVVSPWNGGSGFAGNGKSREAENLLAEVKATDDPRWSTAKDAVVAAEEVVRLCREQGWAGSGSAMWATEHKPKVIEVCRNFLPDAALPWIDATVAITSDNAGQTTLAFNRLLGTGGNFGRQDLQTTYLSRAMSVLLDRRQQKNSKGWLAAALFAEEGTAYLRETVGQFDPGRAGGIMTSPGEGADDKGFANPWQFLFMIEGALLFASAVVRRQGSITQGAALPFLVRPSAVGYGSSADGENAMAEFWAPQWERPASLQEIQQVFGEGRLQWGAGAARTGLDAARAIATLGVSRGLTEFTRFVIVERLGQSPLAIRVGSIAVEERPGTGLLADVDVFLGRLRRQKELPGSVARLIRRLDAAMFAAASATSTTAWRAPLREVLVVLGRLHHAVSRSTKLREEIGPLALRNQGWWEVLASESPAGVDDVEARLARALASTFANDPMPLRTLLTPVELTGRQLHGVLRWGWSSSPAPAPIGAGAAAAVAEAHRRRCFSDEVTDKRERDDAEPKADNDNVVTAGAGTAFAALGAAHAVPVTDLVAWLQVEVDEQRLADLLLGALLLPPPPGGRERAKTSGSVPTSSALALLLPFFGRDAFKPRRPQRHQDDDVPPPLLLRPGATWVSQLIAGQIEEVLSDAARRLDRVGLHNLPLPGVAAKELELAGPPTQVGARLAAALLVPVTHETRRRSLELACDTSSIAGAMGATGESISEGEPQ